MPQITPTSTTAMMGNSNSGSVSQLARRRVLVLGLDFKLVTLYPICRCRLCPTAQIVTAPGVTCHLSCAHDIRSPSLPRARARRGRPARLDAGARPPAQRVAVFARPRSRLDGPHRGSVRGLLPV